MTEQAMTAHPLNLYTLILQTFKLGILLLTLKCWLPLLFEYSRYIIFNVILWAHSHEMATPKTPPYTTHKSTELD